MRRQLINGCLLVLCAIWLLSACSSGGGGGGDTPPNLQDTAEGGGLQWGEANWNDAEWQ